MKKKKKNQFPPGALIKQCADSVRPKNGFESGKKHVRYKFVSHNCRKPTRTAQVWVRTMRYDGTTKTYFYILLCPLQQGTWMVLSRGYIDHVICWAVSESPHGREQADGRSFLEGHMLFYTV